MVINMKHHTQLFIATTLMIIALGSLSACGQKGPLIIDVPSAQGVNSKEVTDDDSVLNTQTEDKSTSR